MSYRLEQQSDGTSRIAEITGAQGLTLPRYRRGWVSVDEKADVLDAVIAEKMAYNAGRPYKHGKRF